MTIFLVFNLLLKLLNYFNSSMWEVLISFFSSNAASGLIGAVIGSLIGSISGYWFNRLLEQKRSRERYSIQRKNTIYSPLYKELLRLKEHLQETKVSKDKRFKVILDENGHTYYGSHSFLIWESMKRDIRASYIPNQLRERLEGLTSLLRNEDGFESECRRTLDSYYSNNISIFDETKNKNHFLGGIGSALNVWLTSSGIRDREIGEFVQGYLKPEYKDQSERIGEELKSKSQEIPAYKNWDDLFTETERCLNDLIDDFKQIINKIIRDYEGKE